MVRRPGTADLTTAGAVDVGVAERSPRLDPEALAAEEPVRRRPLRPAGHRGSWALAAVALLAHQLVAARFPVEWDGAQLVLGLDRFDVTEGSPHPPGYWLYVATGRLLRATTPLDGTASLTLVASLSAAGCVGIVHALGRAVGGRLVGAVAAGLLLSSPLLWFYGASVDTYTLDALACASLMALAWHARPGSRHGVVAAATLGLAAGFRQTSLLLFAPLAVIAVARSARSLRAWAVAGLAGGAAALSWTLPMLAEQPGGLDAWRRASAALLEGSVAQTAFFSGAAGAVTRNMTQAAAYATVMFLPSLVVGALAAAARRSDRTHPAAGSRATGGRGGDRPWWASAGAVAAAGAVPPLAFLVLVHFGKAGYLLAPLPAVVLLLSLPAARLARRGRLLVALATAVLVGLSAWRFLLAPAVVPSRLVDATPLWFTSSVNGAPFPFTRAALAESDELATAHLGLAGAFDPAGDVLVWGWLNGGERYRHATLTLPRFTTSFVRDSLHVHTARGGRWETVPDTTLEVPPGGRAVFVLAHVPPDLQALLDAGTAEAVRLPTGATVWVVRPGVTLLGVRVVEGDTTVDGR